MGQAPPKTQVIGACDRCTAGGIWEQEAFLLVGKTRGPRSVVEAQHLDRSQHQAGPLSTPSAASQCLQLSTVLVPLARGTEGLGHLHGDTAS